MVVQEMEEVQDQTFDQLETFILSKGQVFLLEVCKDNPAQRFGGLNELQMNILVSYGLLVCTSECHYELTPKGEGVCESIKSQSKD